MSELKNNPEPKGVIAPLGDYITLCRKRNKNLETTKLVGVTVEKEIISSLNINKNTSLSTCWIVEKGNFITSLLQVGRDGKLPICLYTDSGIGAVSPSYHVFKVNNSLIKEKYLMIYLKNSRIDSQAVFLAGGGVRDTLSWTNFSKIPIFVPELEAQERIVEKYQTVEKLIKTKKRLNELLEKWMHAYYHILFDNLSIEERTSKSVGELFTIAGGGRPPKYNKELQVKYFCKEGGTPWLQVKDVTGFGFKFVENTKEQLTSEGVEKSRAKLIPAYSLLMIAVGVGKCSIARLGINLVDLYISSHFWHLNYREGKYLYYSYFLLKDIWDRLGWMCVNNSTSTIGLNAQKFSSLRIKVPRKLKLISQFNKQCESLFRLQENNEQIIKKLLRLQKCWIETLN